MHARLLATLLLAFLPGCATDATGERDALRGVAAAFEPGRLPAGQLAGYDAILTADHFGGPIDTWRWGVKDQARAALELPACAGGRDALVALAHRATPEGRLWAVWGLERADPAAFRALAPELRGDGTEVALAAGCFAWRGTCAEAMERFVDAPDDELETARRMLADAR